MVNSLCLFQIAIRWTFLCIFQMSGELVYMCQKGETLNHDPPMVKPILNFQSYLFYVVLGFFYASTVFIWRRCNFALTIFKNWRRMERWFIFMELFVYLKIVCEVWWHSHCIVCISRWQECGPYFKGRIPEVTSHTAWLGNYSIQLGPQTFPSNVSALRKRTKHFLVSIFLIPQNVLESWKRERLFNCWRVAEEEGADGRNHLNTQ